MRLCYAVPFMSRLANINIFGILVSLHEKKNYFTLFGIITRGIRKEFKKCPTQSKKFSKKIIKLNLQIAIQKKKVAISNCKVR